MQVWRAMRAFVAVALVAAAAGTAKVGSRPAAVDARKASLARFGGPASLQPRLEDSDARAGASIIVEQRGLVVMARATAAAQVDTDVRVRQNTLFSLPETYAVPDVLAPQPLGTWWWSAMQWEAGAQPAAEPAAAAPATAAAEAGAAAAAEAEARAAEDAGAEAAPAPAQAQTAEEARVDTDDRQAKRYPFSPDGDARGGPGADGDAAAALQLQAEAAAADAAGAFHGAGGGDD